MKKIFALLLDLALALALLPAPAAEAEQKTFSITGMYYSDYYGTLPNMTVRVGDICPICREDVLYADFKDALRDNPAFHYIRCPNRACKGYARERCSGDAPCGQEGICQVCGNLYHGIHDYRGFRKTDPTCTKIGYRCDGMYCVKCQLYFDLMSTVLTDVVIPALGHDLVHHDAKAPTCAEVGWEEYDTCSRCSYTTYQEIPVSTVHTPGEPVREEPYLIPGLYDMVTYCTVCGKELSRTAHIDMGMMRQPPTHYVLSDFDAFCLDMIDEVRKAPEDGEVEIDARIWDVLPRYAIEALAERPDVTLKLTCRVDREVRELTIPAGFDLITPLGEKKCLTFDEVAQLLG